MDIETFYCKPPIVSNIVSTQDFFVVDKKKREEATHAMKDEALEALQPDRLNFFNEIWLPTPPPPPFLIGKNMFSSLFTMRGNKYRYMEASFHFQFVPHETPSFIFISFKLSLQA